MLRGIYNFFLSLKTSIWLLAGILLLLLAGAVIMPGHEEFQGLHTVPLFPWLAGNEPRLTWWLWGSVALLCLLMLNTVACSIESVFRKWTARKWLLIISPQIIHIGFLLILLAHLLSSTGSYRNMAFAYRDSVVQLPNGIEVLFRDIRTQIDPSGYITDWAADIEYSAGGNLLGRDSILPNSPSFRDGFELNIRTIRVAPFPVAMVEVSREPGAPWALAGGLCFLAGTAVLLVLKVRRDEVLENRDL